MITIIDIIKAYSDLMENVFGAPPITKDIVEVKDRPCTYVQGDVHTELEAGMQHDEYSMSVVYYAPYEDRGYLGLLQAQNLLGPALIAPVQVTDSFHVMPDGVSIDLVRDEMLLICTFTVESFQTWDAGDTATLMDTLDLDIDLNEEE